MKLSSTPSFVLELPLKVDSESEKKLLARLEAGRQVYNACLGEAKKRLALLRQSKAYQKARRMPHKTAEERAARARAFSRARRVWGFTDFSLQQYALEIHRSWIGEHLDAHVAQNLGKRAYLAVNRVALGQARGVRFKGRNQMDTLEGKTNQAGIRWRDGAVEWKGLLLPAIIDRSDPVVAYGLSQAVKYVRLVRRKIGGRNRFYAQLVLKGEPYRKASHPLGKGRVGLDAGPSTLAAVGEKDALLIPFCEELERREKEIRRLQRKLDRQRRANNPQNYDEKGRIKPGKKRWKKSKGYLKTEARLADLYRRQRAHRKSLHGQLANIVLGMGDTFLWEDVSFKAWQKRFGRSIGFRGPGQFFVILRRKAESAGGQVIAFPTKLGLSKTCHCGRIRSKRLSERWHACECGVRAQRDLYSAFLSRFVERNVEEGGETEWRLDAGRAGEAWPGADPLLRAAFERLRAKTNGRVGGLYPPSLGLSSGSEPVAAKSGATV
ncbi:MAG: hypothetical protein PWQ86_1952 [Bacillota bacterium]|jgi:transposase|nr:hypothetical protein [Bacillota bacterium]